MFCFKVVLFCSAGSESSLQCLVDVDLGRGRTANATHRFHCERLAEAMVDAVERLDGTAVGSEDSVTIGGTSSSRAPVRDIGFDRWIQSLSLGA
jgi:hypothetical protein